MHRLAVVFGMLLAGILTLGAQAGAASPAAPGADTGQASPETVQQFDPGYIISDDSFYDASSMTLPDVQRFLEGVRCVPAKGVSCLADYRVDTPTEPARPRHCARYQGVRDERASAIVWKVAQACGISPKTLLVLMQKEQSLLTRPTAYGYQRATGYACPDTAACDSRYFGLFNQLYRAAWQFREYGDSTGWRYHVGVVRVAYSPDPSCGSALVRIRNQATANLYNYTPYQPTASAQRGANASGDACASFGNLNFSRIYRQWFGSPLAVRLPAWWGGCLVHADGTSCRPIRVPPWGP